jgi:hypothetical protein
VARKCGAAPYKNKFCLKGTLIVGAEIYPVFKPPVPSAKFDSDGMVDLKQQIHIATLALADPFDWREVLIDIELEERGIDSNPYVADSCVAVCFCRIDGEWCDHDLDLSAEYRQLFHSLLRANGLTHGTYRLTLAPDGTNSWGQNNERPRRLHGIATGEVDTIIEVKLTGLRADPSN